MRSNPKGVHAERWRHIHGCGRFFNCVRDTVSDRIRATYKPGESTAAMTARISHTRRRPHRSRAAARVHLRRRRYTGCRRHARLGAARQWRASGRPLVQVSPAARHPVRRVGGAERAGDDRSRRRTHHAEPARDAGRAVRRAAGAQPEPLALARLRCRRGQQCVSRRCCPPASTTRPSCGRARSGAHVYEPAIRAAAGLGRAPTAPDPDRYLHHYAHCDVLVVGAGPAGLAAALAASAGGARVMLCDEQAELGGSLLAETDAHIDGRPRGLAARDTGRRSDGTRM